jgi:hypothetical protein
MRLSTSVTEWHCAPPPVDVSRLLRVHKYTDQSKVRPVIRAAAAKAVADAAKLAAPEARYVISPIKSLKEGELILEGGGRLECAAFDRHLSGCRYLLAFVMTIGPELDQTVLKLVEDVFEPLDALFLETAGWLTIEAATKHFARHLKHEFGSQGWTLSLRMGPGYDYRTENSAGRVRWDLWQQRELFQMFKTSPLPVDLMESCAMQPKMSRSGVFGLSPADA